MINQSTFELLKAMKLTAMANELQHQMEDPATYLERTSVISSLAIKTLIKNHVSSIYILFKSKLIFLNSKSPINFYG